jgi:formylglycine-generating enzyme required for sulfatase activity
MEAAANAYSAASCEIRGDGSYGGDDNDKGFYGTGQAWSDSGYVAGAANKSQIRTGVLSNGNVIWDIAGNVWEWTDNLCGIPWDTTAGWVEWNNAGLTDQEKYDAGPSATLTSTNGAGQYYGCTAYGNAFLRGGSWAYAALDGFFTLSLNGAPSNSYTYVGFRCALSQ